MDMRGHRHSFACFETINGKLVCKHEKEPASPPEGLTRHSLSSLVEFSGRKTKKYKIKKPTGESSLSEPRVRFNWGFHDAQHERERG